VTAMKILVGNATRNSGLAVIRALARGGVEIIGADDRRLPIGLHSRYMKSLHLHPPCGEEAFFDRFLEILDRARPDVLIPVGVTRGLIKRREDIECRTRVLLPDLNSYLTAFDNRLTLEKCGELGIPAPRRFSEKEALEWLGRNDMTRTSKTLVVKPRADHGFGNGVGFVDDVDSFRRAMQRGETQYGPMVVEEYIPGGTDAMRTVNLVFDRNSRLAAYFTTRKIRQWPTTGGISAVSVSTDDRDLVEMMLPFFRELNWRGAAEVELKVDARDNIPKVIEVNPRTAGYIGFPVRCGINLPWILCRLSMGESAGAGDYPTYAVGVKYVNPWAAVKSIGQDVFGSRGSLGSIRRAFSDLKGRKVGNNVQITDPMPMVGKLLLQIFEKKEPDRDFGLIDAGRDEEKEVMRTPHVS
jgi:predicted ATP-grasp superfamily ATP-dependent carboligase